MKFKRGWLLCIILAAVGFIGCTGEELVIGGGETDRFPTNPKNDNSDVVNPADDNGGTNTEAGESSEKSETGDNNGGETGDNSGGETGDNNGGETGNEPEIPTPVDCNPGCPEDAKCVEGVCLPICIEGTYCNGDCRDLGVLHMADCSTCADGYCDANGDLSDGCEVNAKGSDSNNCGACGNVCGVGEHCSDGVCRNSCVDGETFCNGVCRRLGDLHMASCDACAADYCNNDGNLDNGCEIYTKGTDVNNCGACGNVCGAGQACSNGTCYTPYKAHRMMVIADELMVRKDAGTSYAAIGSVYEYQYITVLEEKDGWFRHEYNGQQGWSSGAYLLDACDECEGRKAIDYAEQFLYNSSTRLCTWDHLTHAPIISNFTDLWASYQSYNHGYNDNCANFVTACLKTMGLISKNYINVGQINTHCTNGTGGWRKVSFESAKAGDIWVNSSKGHTELVIGYKNNRVYLIGSNNFSSGNGSNLCQMNTGANASAYQRVSYASTTSGNTGFICSRQ